MNEETDTAIDAKAFQLVTKSILSQVLSILARERGGDEWVMTLLAPLHGVADALQNDDEASALMSEALRGHLWAIEEGAQQP